MTSYACQDPRKSLRLSLPSSLVPRPLPDFISQPWRKIGRRPVPIYVTDRKWWTRLVRNVDPVRNDGNVPTQYTANTASNRIVKLARRFANSYGLCKYQVANERCVDVSGRRYACTSTEESSSLRASASLRVKTSLCTRATILKEAQSQG